MRPAMDIRIISWNVFHCQDGARLGPTLGSVMRRRELDDGTHVHRNRKWVDQIADVITSLDPTIAALQEVPPQAVDRIAARTGMRAVSSLMRPVIGPLRLRGRLADANPDLWRTHEGTSNVLLVPSDWTCEERWTFRHNPPLVALRHGHRLRLSLRERLHWILEPRRLVGARLRTPPGDSVVAVSLHCQDARDPRLIGVEIERVLDDIDRRVTRDVPILLAGDFNGRGREHPAIAQLLAAGFDEATLDRLGIDHIFHRNLTTVTPPAALDREVRHHRLETAGGPRVVLLSDHEVLQATYRI